MDKQNFPDIKIKELFKDFTGRKKLMIMGLIHDDFEIIMGDVQSAHKVKMTADQTAKLEQTEQKAIKEISHRFPENIDKYGSHPVPVEFYTPRIKDFNKNHPQLNPLFKTKHPFLTPPLEIDINKVVFEYQPHSKESLMQDVGYSLYDHWKKVIRKCADDEELKNLYTKTE